MINSKLFALLRALDANEFKELEKFVASPYHARGRDFNSLFKVLKPYYPDFNSEQLKREHLFKKLYPGEKYSPESSDHKIRMIFTALYKLCLDFLIFNEFNQDSSIKKYYLLNQLRLKKLYKEFENVFSEDYPGDMHSDEKHPDKGGTVYFLKRHHLNVVYNNYLIDKDEPAKSFEYTLRASENIVVVALMECFKLESLKNSFRLYNFSPENSILNNLLDNLDSEKLLREMEKNNDDYYPLVLIYFMFHKMNRNKDKPEYFYELKMLLLKYQNFFGRSQIYNFWQMILNYCYSVELPPEDFISIYNEMLQNNIYKRTPDEDFHILVFRNIICAGTAAGKSKWLEDFIKKYSPELNVNHRENMDNFSYAHLNFSKGKFKDALEYSNKINYDIFLYKMDVRTLLFKIFFELSYYEQAYSLIHSTLNFLNTTTEFSESRKKPLLRDFKYFKELLKLKTSTELQSYSISSLKNKISEANFFQRQWLLRKLDELPAQ